MEERPAPSEDHVARRASELSRGGEGADALEEDPETAHAAAETILEESEERTFDPATVDPEDEGVIRRTSDETA